jgi:hypothetical protein
LSPVQPTSLHTIASLSQPSSTIQATILWDTGATESYLDHQTAAKLAVSPLAYPKPIELRLFDGTIAEAGPLTHYLDINIKLHQDHPSIPTRVSLTRLYGADIVLGSTWMTKNGVQLDLPNTTVSVLVPSLPSPTVASLQAPVYLVNNPCTFPNNIKLRKLSKWNVPLSSRSPPTLVSIDTASTLRATLDPAESIENRPSDIPIDLPLDQFDIPLNDEEVETETRQLLVQLPEYCHSYLDIFRQKQGTETLAPSRAYDMPIDLIPSPKLAAAKLYQLTETERIVLLETLERETKAGRIRSSNAAYGSPMFFVAKKDGRHRMVVDYRRLNENTIPDAYPLPLISQIWNDLTKAKYYTKLDLTGAYQLLRMKEGHEHLTAFRTQYGMFESLVVRDGLRNAPAYFQHFLNDVFKEILGRGVVVYIDDILIYSNTLDELRRLTLKVFEITRRSSLYLKAIKCEFEKTSIGFLGVRISGKGIETDPEKIKAVREFPVPINLRHSRSDIIDDLCLTSPRLQLLSPS